MSGSPPRTSVEHVSVHTAWPPSMPILWYPVSRQTGVPWSWEGPWRRRGLVGDVLGAVTLVASLFFLLPLACDAQSENGSNAAPSEATPGTVMLQPLTVIGASPLIGSGIDRDSVPGETHVLTGADISRIGTPNAVESLNQQVGGVTLDSASGNPFQPTLLYHGFQASPLQGVPQGLAVYVNGMRFNQPFGDTVDWDVIPDIAIDRINVVGSNPVYGLNALGGALNVLLKNGFGYHGFEADLSGGSFSQRQGEFQYGQQDGDTSFYVAGNALQQGGWRDLQSSEIYNLYGDFGWRGQVSEVHANITVRAYDSQWPRDFAGAIACRRFARPIHRPECDCQPVPGNKRKR